MKKALTGTFPFNASAKTVDLSSVPGGFNEQQLYAVANITAKAFLYVVGSQSYKGDFTSNILTFEGDNTGMLNTDILFVVYEDPSDQGVSDSSTHTALASILSQLEATLTVSDSSTHSALASILTQLEATLSVSDTTVAGKIDTSNTLLTEALNPQQQSAMLFDGDVAGSNQTLVNSREITWAINSNAQTRAAICSKFDSQFWNPSETQVYAAIQLTNYASYPTDGSQGFMVAFIEDDYDPNGLVEHGIVNGTFPLTSGTSANQFVATWLPIAGSITCNNTSCFSKTGSEWTDGFIVVICLNLVTGVGHLELWDEHGHQVSGNFTGSITGVAKLVAGISCQDRNNGASITISALTTAQFIALGKTPPVGYTNVIDDYYQLQTYDRLVAAQLEELNATSTTIAADVADIMSQVGYIIGNPLPLNPSAATAALQTTGNATLSDIDSKTPALNGDGGVPSHVTNWPSSYPVTFTRLAYGTDSVTIQGGNSVAVKVDGSAVTQPISGNVGVTGSVAVTGTFWQATQPVSITSLPLPTGAATSAKQAALGTAGTASSDVITIQGITGMTAVRVDGSAVNQPVTQAVANWTMNLTQIGGNAVVTGTGASGVGIPRVTVSNDSSVSLNAGTNIVGKVGIDQTTNGTTNGVYIVNSISISSLPTVVTNADTTIGGTSAPSKMLLVGGKTNDATAQYQAVPLGTAGSYVVTSGPTSQTTSQSISAAAQTVTLNTSAGMQTLFVRFSNAISGYTFSGVWNFADGSTSAFGFINTTYGTVSTNISAGNVVYVATVPALATSCTLTSAGSGVTGTIYLSMSPYGFTMVPQTQAISTTTSTSSGISVYTAIGGLGNALLTNTSTQVKSSAGSLYSVQFYNPNASMAYVQVYDATSVTVGTTVPKFSFPIPANGYYDFSYPGENKWHFATGLAVAATTTATGNTAPTTGITAHVGYA